MRILALLSAFAMANTCATTSSQEPATQSIEMKKIAAGSYASSRGPSVVAVFDQASYRQTWSSMIGSDDPPPADFSTQSVVFVIGGSRPTGGYDVEIRSATVEGDELVLDAVVNAPPQGAIVTQAFTTPYAVVMVESRDFKRVKWDGAREQTPVDR